MSVVPVQDHWKRAALSILLVAIGTFSAKADDCGLARQEYDRGIQLIILEERCKAFEKAAKLCPSFAEAHVNLADAYENLALQRTPEDPQYNKWINLAISYYRQAAEQNPTLFPPHFGLGVNYMRTGQLEMAKQAFGEALAVNPGDKETKVLLAKVELKLRNQNEGFQTKKKILETAKKSEPASGSETMSLLPEVHVRDRQRFVNILFEEWSSQLKGKETFDQLNEIGEALASEDLAKCSFVIEGHTDPRGDPQRNRILSQDRAKAVGNYLVKKFGIDRNRISTQGLGFARPRFPNTSPENMQRNRRVELLVIFKESGH
jgi:outer membrane protein OmpA-like peptidoglycan-associated protein